jgi:signal transduction histidine kinase
LTLAFFVVALVPASLILSLTWFTVVDRFEDEFNQRLDGVSSGLKSDLDRIGQRIQKKVKAISQTKGVERILIDRVRHRLDRRALIHIADDWMKAWNLDVLTVMDGDGRILSCGHLPALFGNRAQEALKIAETHPMKPTSMLVKILQDGRIQVHLAVVVGVLRRFENDGIAIVGGRLLDRSFVDHLEKLSGSLVAIVDEQEKIIVSGKKMSMESQGVFHDSSAISFRRIDLGSPPDGIEANVIVGVSKTKLTAAQDRILIASMGAGVLSVFVSCLLGWLLSRRITKPVDALVEGARAVATGNLDHHVDVIQSAEIGELVRTFNSMVEDLGSYQKRLVRAERVAAWQEIARRIAHEIKNPLSPIQMSIETLQKAYAGQHPDFPEIFDESTRAISEEVHALKRIVTEFSSFARLPKAAPVVQPLNPIIENAVGLYRNQSSKVRIRCDLAEDLPDVQVDRELMGQVLSNLLSNAFGSIDEEGLITVKTGRDAYHAFIEVNDNGAGMTNEVMNEIFTPYFTSRADGTGLGLAIVERIIEDHHGSIEVESIFGEGTTFTLSLPL